MAYMVWGKLYNLCKIFNNSINPIISFSSSKNILAWLVYTLLFLLLAAVAIIAIILLVLGINYFGPQIAVAM